MNRERIAAALEFDRKRRAQDYLMSEPGTQPLTQGEDVLGFLRGVGGNLAGRAQSAYDLATTPSRWIPEAKNAVTGLVEFGKAAISDPAGTGRAIAQGEVQRASQAAGSPEAMGDYAANFIDPLRLAKALRYRGPIAELDVYHGTPHRFPATEANPLGEFDASKIGTGEGAQAYGHGIYLAEAENVGRDYAQSLSQRLPNRVQLDNTPIKGDTIFSRAIEKLGTQGKEAALKDLDDSIRRNETYAPDMAELYRDVRRQILEIDPKKVNVNQGTLYKADLPDEMIDRMLDWDKPFLDQSQEIKDLARNLLPPAVYNQLLTQRSGDFVEELAKYKGGKAKASELMRQASIPGIKYLDAGSRGQGGSGTRNFVVFPGEEKKVRILERDGQKAPPQPTTFKMVKQEPELTRRAKQFQEIKDAAIGKLYNKVDEETGDYIYPQNRSLVEAFPNVMGNYTGDATLKRKVGNGEIHLAIKSDFNNVVGDEDGFGRMHVYLSAEGDVPKGTGAATEMYLEALAIAQQKGLGFVSDSIRSQNAENIYRRLIKKGVPFKKGFLYEDKSWVLTSDEVAKLDLPAIAAKPYK